MVGLKQNKAGLMKLEEKFWQVSDPKHADYGDYMSMEEVADLVAADSAHVEQVSGWLRGLGARDIELMPNKDCVTATLDSPSKASLKAPRVPLGLKPTVDFVVALGGKVQAHGRFGGEPRNTTVEAGVSGMSLGAQKKAYQMPADLKTSNPGNVQMVWGTGTFGYRDADLQLFFQTYCPACNTTMVEFDADNDWIGETGENFVEGELDTEYISGMAVNTRTLVSNTNISAATESGPGFGAALIAFTSALNARSKDVPLVLSMSLGSLGFDSCDRLCKGIEANGKGSYAKCWKYLQAEFQVCMFEEGQQERINTEFMKLGLRGVSIFAASGDGGSHFSFGPFSTGDLAASLNEVICKTNGGINMPVFPTSSPYLTSVGGTQWQSESYGPECSATQPCGWTDGGGGFSWDFAAPDYQKNVTATYLTGARAFKVMTPEGSYNANGRGYPDLSALAAVGIPVCDYGGCSGSGGTSASAPTIAGMFTQINDARLNGGLKPLGFLNPRLYQTMADPAVFADCFWDVGSNYGTPGPFWDNDAYSTCSGCDTGGFPATAGWDAQTGFGQPKFPCLLKHFGSD